MADCLVALGSNVGDRRSVLDQCVQQFCAHPQIRWLAQSTYHATIPIGGPAAQDSFLNAALRVETSLSPRQLLHWALGVERRLGRVRRVHWGPRVIDIDLLLYDQQVVVQDDLELPHPRMIVRRFVLDPASQIAADMIHPTTGWSIEKLKKHMESVPLYIALAGVPCSGKTTVTKTLAKNPRVRVVVESSARADMRPIANNELLRFLRGREQGDHAERQEAMRQVARHMSSTACRFVVSDFWLDQPFADGSTWYDGRSQHLGPLSAVSDDLRRPALQLVILLDVSIAVVMERVATLAGSVLDEITRATIRTCVDQYSRALRRIALQPGHGPILRVQGKDVPVLEDIQAALAALG